MTTMGLPIVSTCGSTGCSYNHDSDCHAAAITVTSGCGTYVEAAAEAGIDTQATVGACHRAECVHNSALECGAESVQIGPSGGVADCLTYSAR
ncbi:DUF1540 domain-containing protein [Nocardioides sp. CFH 31398]|uniref:DUF1540 domain-containing protein n=1 Tax=Nocardioides sp. CFH 31398 TaxID=2919579 RepID=UPI001F066A8B|nr:DUF1540 domain-containing protein [Nocardioides sp. CFH 31398]MCH1865486.1 DUF1540 domain-containing protein [Nocardioides sp. CFH 31398]